MPTDFISIPLHSSILGASRSLRIHRGQVTVAAVHNHYERFVSLLWNVFVQQASRVARFGSGARPFVDATPEDGSGSTIPLLFWIGRPALASGTAGVSVVERIGALPQCAEVLSSLDALHCLRCGTQVESQSPDSILREAVDALASTETLLVTAELSDLQSLELERSRASDVFESFGLERVIEAGEIKKISDVFTAGELSESLGRITSRKVTFVLGTLPVGASAEDIRECLQIARNCSRQRVTLIVSERRSVRAPHHTVSLERGCPLCGGEVVTSKMVRVIADSASALRILSEARVGQLPAGSILKSSCRELKASVDLPQSLARLLVIMTDCGLEHVRLGAQLDALTPTERVQLEVVQLLNDTFSDVLVVFGELGVLLEISLLERIFEAINTHASGVTTLVALPNFDLPQHGCERIDVEWNETDRSFVCLEFPMTRESLSASRLVVAPERAGVDAEGVVTLVSIDSSAAASTPRDTIASILGLEEVFADRLAATIEARLRGFDRAAFDSRRSPYRCEECGGAGIVASDASSSLMPALVRFLACSECDGRRFTEEPLGITFRGLSLDEFCRTPAEDLLAPFSDAPKEIMLARILCRLGLGHLAVGTPVLRLTPMERVRLELAQAVVSLGKSARGGRSRGVRSLHLSGVLEATSPELRVEIRGILAELGETGIQVRASI